MEKRIIVTTSWDDGHPLDLKLASLLNEYNIKATFYLPIESKVRKTMDCSNIQDIGEYFEIGAHTINHSRLLKLEYKSLVEEIRGSKDTLENIIGKTVNTFCYPWGEYNCRVKQAVIHSGFRGARNTQELRLTVGNDPFQMPTTILAFPQKSFIRIRHCVRTFDYYGLRKYLSLGINRSWVQLASDLFQRLLIIGGVWHLWGHSWEIEENALWDQLEEVFAIVSNHPEVEYLTNGEVLRQYFIEK